MRTPRLPLAIVLALPFLVAAAPDAGRDARPLARIGLGSCAKQDRPQPIWDAVLAAKPEIFVLLGDNIYGDTQDMAVMKRKYDQFAAVPGFAKLRETCPILATWDDHDYGVNDGGKEYPKRRESQQVFLDFFAEPADSPRRGRDGVYDVQTFGPPGKRVQFILLDTRSGRDLLKDNTNKTKGAGPYMPDPDPAKRILSDEQWAWLEARLREPAELRIICSSIQFVVDEHGWEKWGNFPAERQRMVNLIRDTKANGVVFVSGDRHLAELSKMADAGVPYPLYDLTASSLNQPHGRPGEQDPSRYRIGRMYQQANFGLINIDWSANDPAINFQILDVAGKVVIDHTARLSELRAK